jgi:hypothetical protein
MVDKILHRKVKIEQNKPKIKPGINLIAMEGY